MSLRCSIVCIETRPSFSFSSTAPQHYGLCISRCLPFPQIHGLRYVMALPIQTFLHYYLDAKTDSLSSPRRRPGSTIRPRSLRLNWRLGTGSPPDLPLFSLGTWPDFTSLDPSVSTRKYSVQPRLQVPRSQTLQTNPLLCRSPTLLFAILRLQIPQTEHPFSNPPLHLSSPPNKP